MKERIESLEREVMELRMQLRLLQGIVEKVQDSIDELPSDFYMPLWGDHKGEEGQNQTAAMRSWRRKQRELQAIEAQLADTENKDSDEARYLVKRLESQREDAQIYEHIVNQGARRLVEANMMATHDWQLVRVVRITEVQESREETCSLPYCHATRELSRLLRDGQVDYEGVVRSYPRPMMSCPYDVVEVRG